jgi:hypothetical protein
VDRERQDLLTLLLLLDLETESVGFALLKGLISPFYLAFSMWLEKASIL